MYEEWLEKHKIPTKDKPLQKVTGKNILGFPLVMNIYFEPEDDKITLYVKIPLRIKGRSYRSPFATQLRKEKHDSFGYIRIYINLQKKQPFYINEFYVFSNIQSNKTLVDPLEITKGIGKQLLCTAFHYLTTLPWLRKFIKKDEMQVYLLAAGGQLSPHIVDKIKSQPFEESLQQLSQYEQNAVEILNSILYRLEPSDQYKLISKIRLKLVKRIRIPRLDIIQREAKKIIEHAKIDAADEEEEMYFLTQISTANQISQLFLEHIELLIEFIIELNSTNPEFDIPQLVTNELVLILDNTKLVEYYHKTYGFTPRSNIINRDGRAVLMDSSVNNIIKHCFKNFQEEIKERASFKGTRKSNKKNNKKNNKKSKRNHTRYKTK